MFWFLLLQVVVAVVPFSQQTKVCEQRVELLLFGGCVKNNDLLGILWYNILKKTNQKSQWNMFCSEHGSVKRLLRLSALSIGKSKGFYCFPVFPHV